MLDDGDLLYVAPGVLHAHPSGLAVEVMADSDDVVRAGLTSKFVDPMVLVGLLRPERLVDVEMATGSVHRYDLEVNDIVLRRLSGTGLDVEVGGSGGPELLLCTDGSASVRSGDGRYDLVAFGGGGSVDRPRGRADGSAGGRYRPLGGMPRFGVSRPVTYGDRGCMTRSQTTPARLQKEPRSTRRSGPPAIG
ncbi:MAG: hypothetical protein Ct9H300mP12_05300 [Acidimicrobiales bacterium]|nr:MAG: hypothetical protein Ct9H300mP12_05300 [Acidimicrobiales bacterium]